MRIEIAPVQDLHGYASPWTGGAGKNMLKLASSYEERYGITYAPNPATGEIVIDGTAESLEQVTLCNIDLTNVATGTTLYINGMSNNSDCHTTIEYLDGSSIAIRSIPDTGDYMIVPEGATYVKVSVRIMQGVTVNNAVMEPFVAKSETALPFEPYANICPISGWTGCNVTQTGKNLFDGAFTTNSLISDTGSVSTNNDHKISTNYIPVKSSSLYTISGKDVHKRPSGSSSTTNTFVNIARYRADKSFIDRAFSSQTSDLSYTFETTDETAFIRFTVGIEGYDVQVEHGQEASGYTPFVSSDTYSIAFPSSAGTVYGGTLTINRDGTGELIVDKKALNITSENVISSLNGGAGFYRAILKIPNDSIVSNDGNVLTGKLMSDQYVEIANTAGNQGGIGLTYRGNNTHTIVLSNPQVNSSATADWKTWIDANPFTIIYELAEPVPYSLTAPQVQLLLGLNNVWADTGSILSMVYPVEKYLTNEQAEKERINIVNDTPADVMSFSDGADDLPMALKIGIEPVQDLNGYDNPWIGGGGKNLLNADMLVEK